MIWALLAAYFLSGGGMSGTALTSASVKQISEHAETIITDPARSEAALETLSDLRDEVKAFDKQFGKAGRQLNKSYRNHSADREEALVVIAELNSGWQSSQHRALDLRFELKDSLTEEEWNELFPPN